MNIPAIIDVMPKEAASDAKPAESGAPAAEGNEMFLPMLLQLVASGLAAPSPASQLKSELTSVSPSAPADGGVPLVEGQKQGNASQSLGALIQGRLGLGARRAQIAQAQLGIALSQPSGTSGISPKLTAGEKSAAPASVQVPEATATVSTEPFPGISPEIAHAGESNAQIFLSEQKKAAPAVSEQRAERSAMNAMPSVDTDGKIPIVGMAAAEEPFSLPASPAGEIERENKVKPVGGPRTESLNPVVVASPAAQEMPNEPSIPEAVPHDASPVKMPATEGNPQTEAAVAAPGKSAPHHADGQQARQEADTPAKQNAHTVSPNTQPVKTEFASALARNAETGEITRVLHGDELRASVMDQIVNAVRMNVTEHSTEVRVTLKPESLGEVVVHVKLEEGAMQAKIDVQTPVVKNILEVNLPALREQLSAKGVELQRIDIVANTQTSLQNAAGQNGTKQQQQNSKRASFDEGFPDDPEFLRTLGYNTMEWTM